MAITDLAGKTLTFNDSIASLPETYTIDFYVLSQNSYQSLEDVNGHVHYVNSNENIRAYDYRWGWMDTNYQTITITGGDDATNATLIAWLLENSDLQDEPEPEPEPQPEPTVSPVPSSFKSIAITEHRTYITLEFNGEEYDLELSNPLESPSENKITFSSFAQVSVTDNVLNIGDRSYELKLYGAIETITVTVTNGGGGN